ncbi:MAG TPA: helix-turn-helix transcriptional regulator [Ruminococcus flavefaciens]|nr:helix-turn-helix transcriptional regulator [Ruminococcus flavefaciens]
MKIIGERLKQLRTGVQLSQTQIGKMFGTGQSNIFKYESGMSTVPTKIMLQYADYFDVSMDYLYGRTDDPHGKYYAFRTPEVEKAYPEMDKFIEMCFEPGTAMNERLKETLKEMMREESENAGER